VSSRPGHPLLPAHESYPLPSAARRPRIFHRGPHGLLDVAVLLFNDPLPISNDPLQISHLPAQLHNFPLLLGPDAAAEEVVVKPRAQPGEDDTGKNSEQNSPAENLHQRGVVRDARTLPSPLPRPEPRPPVEKIIP